MLRALLSKNDEFEELTYSSIDDPGKVESLQCHWPQVLVAQRGERIRVVEECKKSRGGDREPFWSQFCVSEMRFVADEHFEMGETIQFDRRSSHIAL